MLITFHPSGSVQHFTGNYNILKIFPQNYIHCFQQFTFIIKMYIQPKIKEISQNNYRFCTICIYATKQIDFMYYKIELSAV